MSHSTSTIHTMIMTGLTLQVQCTLSPIICNKNCVHKISLDIQKSYHIVTESQNVL